ncbi:MAG: DUF47 family protein [Ruthenibacterium sp.]
MGLFNRDAEYDYFGGFLTCAHSASAAATYLNAALTGFDAAQVPRHMEAMHKIENDADSQKHEITNKLAHEFMTPIEREDISALSRELDNVVDAVEDVIRRIYMFNVTSLRAETLEFTSLIVACCLKMEKVVEEFRNFKKSKIIKDMIIEVNTLESEGDRLHAAALHRLFTEENDPKTLLVWMTLFEALEECLDTSENVADVIESVIMKNT